MTLVIEPNAAGTPTGNEATAALRASPLFAQASDAELALLALACRIESFAAGAVVIREGEEARDLYLLLSGELLSYTHDDLGRELALLRMSEVNQPFGEQAILRGARRSSSVRAVTDSRALRVPGAAFREMVDRDHALGERLRNIGAQQIRLKVCQQMALLRHLASGSHGSAGLQEEIFPDGAVICRQGEAGRKVYVILAGAVRVFRTDPDGSIVQLARLNSGQSFGELSLVTGQPRVANVVADGELRVLAIDGDHFRRAYEADEQVRSHAAALRSIYSYAGSGIVVQFAAELFDRAALGTLYRLDDGRVVVAHRVIGQDIWSIQQDDPPTNLVEESFVDLRQGIERTLQISGYVVVGAVVKGPWSGVGQLHALVLERSPLSPFEIETFRRTGELPQAPSLVPLDDPVVCQCMRVTRGALAAAMQGGCQTVQALSGRTGAGTVCGGCLPQLAELTAEALWQMVRCLEVIERAPRVRSFRLEVPREHRAGTIRPGQHLVVQATIGGVEVRRSYTLTSPATERDDYEITVQREPHGLMSPWLFDYLRPGVTVEVLPPSGTCFFELADPRPLVCLVGGIGVTPALGICRSAAASGATRRLHIDYSVSSHADVVCGDELHALATAHSTVTVHTRLTREQGRFRASDIGALAGRFPGADWLVCGSKPFQTDAQRLLREQGIALRHIHIESFDAVGGAAPFVAPATAVLSPAKRRLVGYGLLLAIAAFVIQALIGIKWPLLARLQATTVYSALTGSGLLGLLMLQWHLGYVRWRSRAQDTLKQASRSYGFHIAVGPAVLGMMWLHSTHLGYALSMAVSLSFLASLATGAVLGAHPRSPRWDGVRRLLLCAHIILSCAGSAFALTHGFTALWY
jgi:ferredoxin-NADP reductase/CRP-like cAMP-binding protein